MNTPLLPVISLTTLILLPVCESIAKPSTHSLDTTQENVVDTGDQARSEDRRADGAQRGGRRGPGPGNAVAAPVPDIDPNSLEVYKAIDGVELNAHIFNPEGHSSGDSRPVMVFLHGGALRFGSPTEGYELAERFIPDGVVVISAEYRLLGTNAETVDQLVSDTKSIIRWTRENADRLGIDPEKVLVSGHGSGAYLTMLAVVLDEHDDPLDNLAISAMPDSVIFWSLLTTRRDNPRSSMVPEGYTMADFSAPEVCLLYTSDAADD